MKHQKTREELLEQVLVSCNEGRSKSYYCIAASVLDESELTEALDKARKVTLNSEIKEKSKILHEALDAAAKRRKLVLKLRKYVKRSRQ